jgi:CBS domain-containing protein
MSILRVKEIMTSEPRTCTAGTNLCVAAELMIEGDCGILPVVENELLTGVVTDRDLFIALGTRNRRASELTVGDVVQTPAVTCGPDDDVHSALIAMKDHSVRRLPVVASDGVLVGMLSIDDILRAAGPQKPVRRADVIETLQSICGRHHPAAHVVAA